MKKSVRHQTVIIFLGITSFIIWMMVIIQIRKTLDNSTTFENLPSNETLSSESHMIPEGYHDSLFISLDYIRDPFQQKQIAFKPPEPVSPLPRTLTEKVVKNISYTGFLIDSKGPLALLELEDGTALICREGETHHQIQILRIDRENLTVTNQGIKSTISLLK